MLAGGEAMTTELEEVVDLAMAGEEPLGIRAGYSRIWWVRREVAYPR